MSNNKRKEFSIRQVFDNFSSLSRCDNIFGDIMTHYGAYSEHFLAFSIYLFCCRKIRLHKNPRGNLIPLLSFYNSSRTGDDSINSICDVFVNGKPLTIGLEFQFKYGIKELNTGCILRKDFSDYQTDDSVRIEFRVKINWMTGIKEKQKSMNFDDDVAKEASDVTLMVGDQEFCVFKNYLSLHSTYSKVLFFGNFSESQKSEIELKDIDPEDFQDFLEIIYGVSAVDDETVSEILSLSDYFDAKNAVKRCEDFLMNYSRKSLKQKFGMAVDYKMENLKNKCLSENQNSDDFPEVFPEVSDDHENCIYRELLEKSMSFK